MFPLSKSPARGANLAWNSPMASANGAQIGRLRAAVKVERDGGIGDSRLNANPRAVFRTVTSERSVARRVLLTTGACSQAFARRNWVARRRRVELNSIPQSGAVMLNFISAPELGSPDADERRNVQMHVFVTRPELATGLRRPISEGSRGIPGGARRRPTLKALGHDLVRKVCNFSGSCPKSSSPPRLGHRPPRPPSVPAPDRRCRRA